MPPDIAAWMEFGKTLGVAAPLVGFLVYIYHKTDSERRETQSKFLEALQTTMLTNAQDRQANTAALIDLTSAVREGTRASTSEHEKMLTLMQKMADQLDEKKGH